ncbi:UbiD family decarboxylase [Tardisphaera miroshnichenkoae]
MEAYERVNPSDVIRINEVDPSYEPTAYYYALQERNPLILFERVKGYEGFRMVTNALGSEKRLAFALGIDRGQSLFERWNFIMTSHKIPLMSEDAPIKQVVSRDKEVDLSRLPVPVHFTQDGTRSGFQRYITGGIVVARDPERKAILNLSFTRIQIIGKDRYAFDCGSKGHLFTYVQKALKKGIPMPITVIIGVHPLLYLLAASFTESEYEKAASVLPFAVTQGVENDIPVPAEAEIALEAELLPESFDEGPFSEYTGYVGLDSTKNVARVKSVLRRKDAIYYDVQPSNSNEHVNLFSFPRHAAVQTVVNSTMPPGHAYKLSWPQRASNYMVLGYVDPPQPGLAKQLGLLLLASDPLFSKLALVNEGPANLSTYSLLANLAANYSPDRVEVIKGLYSIGSNPTGANGTSAKLIAVSSGNTSFSVKANGRSVRLIEDGRTLLAMDTAKTSEGVINVRFPSDVERVDEDTLAWVLATRVRPNQDVDVKKDGIDVDATRTVGEAPELPAEILKRIRARLSHEKI